MTPLGVFLFNRKLPAVRQVPDEHELTQRQQKPFCLRGLRRFLSFNNGTTWLPAVLFFRARTSARRSGGRRAQRRSLCRSGCYLMRRSRVFFWRHVFPPSASCLQPCDSLVNLPHLLYVSPPSPLSSQLSLHFIYTHSTNSFFIGLQA